MSKQPTLVHVALIGIMLGACGQAGPIAEIKGPIKRVGQLSLRKIDFATDDYYVRPTVAPAEEGWVHVPADHSVASSADTFTVHFVRFRSSAQRPGSPIVYLAGGPPGSGTYSAAGDRFKLFMKLRQAADVIAFDQRGTFFVDPAPECPGTWSYPLDQPFSREELARRLKPYLENCARIWRDSIDLTLFNTVQSAHDLEALRISLHADKLTLWGISYGTHLALAYIRLYPNRVDRAILAGVEGPNHTWKSPRNVDAVLQSVSTEIARDPKAGSLLPFFADSLRAVLARLTRHPVSVRVAKRGGDSVNVVIGAGDLQRAVYYALGEREDIARMTRRIVPILRGDYRALGEFALRTRPDNTESVMGLSMDCSAGVTDERSKQIEEEARTAILDYAANIDIAARCASWPRMDVGEEFRSPVRAATPILFISGTLDARTPPANAEEVRRTLPNARHLIIERGSHDDDLFLSSPEIAKRMLTFLQTGQVNTARIRLARIDFETP